MGKSPSQSVAICLDLLGDATIRNIEEIITVYIRSIHMGRTELYMGLWIYCHIDSGRGWTMPCNVVDTPHSTQAYGCIFWIFDQAPPFLIITTAGRTGKTWCFFSGFFYMKHHETIWVWVNTYRYIFSGMNIHKSQLFWGSLGTRVLTHPHMKPSSSVHPQHVWIRGWTILVFLVDSLHQLTK